MAIKHISVVSIPVTDQDRAKAFYEGTLGFTVLHDNQMSPEMRWLQLSPPGSDVSVALVNWMKEMLPGKFGGLVLEVDDIAATIADLRARGVEVNDADTTPWGLFATFEDPDTNALVLREAPKEG
jgi:predicted enzyme related to lactoylglutathione lyase